MTDPTVAPSLARELRALQIRINGLERAQRMPYRPSWTATNPDALTPPTVHGDPVVGRSGPSVTVTVPPSGQVLVGMSMNHRNPGTGVSGTFTAGVRLTGANVRNEDALLVAFVPAASSPLIRTLGASVALTGLNPGTTQFEVNYSISGVTSTIEAGTSRLLVLAA